MATSDKEVTAAIVGLAATQATKIRNAARRNALAILGLAAELKDAAPTMCASELLRIARNLQTEVTQATVLGAMLAALAEHAEQSVTEQWPCANCDRVFSSREALVTHQETE